MSENNVPMFGTPINVTPGMFSRKRTTSGGGGGSGRKPSALVQRLRALPPGQILAERPEGEDADMDIREWAKTKARPAVYRRNKDKSFAHGFEVGTHLDAENGVLYVGRAEDIERAYGEAE